MSMAEGVIVAKARSMHGEALSEEMYQELLHKKSVAEIAGYLKHETSYAGKYPATGNFQENHEIIPLCGCGYEAVLPAAYAAD